jgi:pyridoxal phosphate enzyme (YggS family)
MGIEERIKRFDNVVSGGQCTLVAVSKTKPVEVILEAYQAGHRDFGENKVQELREKQPQLPDDIRWHMIGHLQTNKVKYIAPYIHLIHAVDSLKLLVEINKQAARFDRVMPCLLQVHIAEEETKFGFSLEEIRELLVSEGIRDLKNIRIRGLMGMATYTDDIEQIRQEFRSLKSCFEQLKTEFSLPNMAMEILSMGMSDDFEIALEEGSNMIRVGSKIFGPRHNH